MILYLHGFRSSPLSFKARLIGERLQELGLSAEYVCPQLPASPRLAIELLQALIANQPPTELALIGSSLGGFYATWLAEQTGCRAALLNPAVKAPLDLERYVGVSTAWHSEQPFEFKQEYLAELQVLEVSSITRPERYFLLTATGDEVLDWQEMTAHYRQARQRIIQGSDHGIANFADYLDEVLAFCGVASEGDQ